MGGVTVERDIGPSNHRFYKASTVSIKHSKIGLGLDTRADKKLTSSQKIHEDVETRI